MPTTHRAKPEVGLPGWIVPHALIGYRGDDDDATGHKLRDQPHCASITTRDSGGNYPSPPMAGTSRGDGAECARSKDACWRELVTCVQARARAHLARIDSPAHGSVRCPVRRVRHCGRTERRPNDRRYWIDRVRMTIRQLFIRPPRGAVGLRARSRRPFCRDPLSQPGGFGRSSVCTGPDAGTQLLMRATRGKGGYRA
jgi:hypothetical protein